MTHYRRRVVVASDREGRAFELPEFSAVLPPNFYQNGIYRADALEEPQVRSEMPVVAMGPKPRRCSRYPFLSASELPVRRDEG
jgi:hypothetical protein